jgi:hypothetical protein
MLKLNQVRKFLGIKWLKRILNKIERKVPNFTINADIKLITSNSHFKVEKQKYTFLLFCQKNSQISIRRQNFVIADSSKKVSNIKII